MGIETTVSDRFVPHFGRATVVRARSESADDLDAANWVTKGLVGQQLGALGVDEFAQRQRSALESCEALGADEFAQRPT